MPPVNWVGTTATLFFAGTAVSMILSGRAMFVYRDSNPSGFWAVVVAYLLGATIFLMITLSDFLG
jgi:RsiW-degrading membrane proteinase PrsW (M82 family)